MPFVFGHHVPDRCAVFAHRLDDLLRLAQRYARVVAALNDEKRFDDFRRVVERRNPIQALTVICPIKRVGERMLPR